MAVTVNWIPVEERLPDVDNHEEVTYVTYEDLTTGERKVKNNVHYIKFPFGILWVLDYLAEFENEERRVVAWSTDTVDILPY